MLASGRRTSRDTIGSIKLDFVVENQHLPILGFSLRLEFWHKWSYCNSNFRLGSGEVIVRDVEQNTGAEAGSENSSRSSAVKYEIHMLGKNPPEADKCPTYFGYLREKSRAVVPGRPETRIVGRERPTYFGCMRKKEVGRSFPAAYDMVRKASVLPDISGNHDKHLSGIYGLL